MTMLTTKQFGDPYLWPWPQNIIAATIWDIAQRKYDDKLFEINPAITKVSVRLIEVIEACPNVDGTKIPKAVNSLLALGMIETVDLLEWDDLFITGPFILAQQEAKAAQTRRTIRLADLLVAKASEYQYAVSRLGVSESFETQVLYQKKIGICIDQLAKIKKRAARWGQERLIDSKLWSSRVIDYLTTDRQQKPERHYAD